MRDDEMLSDVALLRSTLPAGSQLTGVTHDSRRTRPGDVFVAVRGLKADGLAHARAAAAAGAAAIVVGPGRSGEAEEALAGAGVPVIEVADERVALAVLGRNAAGRPDLEMPVVGVTGTNGKTTTAYLLAEIWEAAGVRCGMLGTIEYRLGRETLHGERTTPEAPEIHRYLRRMLDDGARACVMEVSSQGLDLGRAYGLRFAAAVFTNLTRDHLDYHGDMETYFAAKKRLFDGLPPGSPSILNADDAYALRLADPGRRRVTYGTAAAADFRLAGRQGGIDGLTLTIDAEGRARELRSPLAGLPNAYNILAAAATARALDLPWGAIEEGLSRRACVPGRLERVDAGQPFAVVVDFAHTDDALRNVLEVLRPLTEGRLIVVFGCGGDRDRTKRPLMGAHAARLADAVWITSDNPRSEEPLSIIGMVLDGVRGVPGGSAKAVVEPDREAAIGRALAGARPGDTVLIAGKGHEGEQILGDRVIPFDDVEVARRLLRARRGAEGGDAGGEPR
ncbi:MAG: UDP-N-acetylmuramoyl-L-alanyl-D-glutamate--2,6-diaminopimelate ligase [Acidobacteria bacterium]|nr:UDP-N-acetylmuramoyl-L-alanyl-D-glutamate--2,6-diaminopimelate ligase [Acidobacteriota bacterium]